MSREERGFRIVEGVVAIAANIKARFVADFDPGISIVAFIGLLAAVKPPRKGAFQLVICPSLPSTVLGSSRFVRAQRLLLRGINHSQPRFYLYECCARSTG